MRVSQRGGRRLQQKIDRMARNLSRRRGGVVSRMLEASGNQALPIARRLTPVDQGDLRDSHRLEVDEQAGEARIFIDPNVTNDRGVAPAFYGPIVHEKYDPFYENTVNQGGDAIAGAAFKAFEREMFR